MSKPRIFQAIALFGMALCGFMAVAGIVSIVATAVLLILDGKSAIWLFGIPLLFIWEMAWLEALEWIGERTYGKS